MHFFEFKTHLSSNTVLYYRESKLILRNIESLRLGLEKYITRDEILDLELSLCPMDSKQ
jgi:hypothetical protein